MLTSLLQGLGLKRTKRIKASRSRPGGNQFEQHLGPELLCVFLADDGHSAEVVFGSGPHPRVFGRGEFEDQESLRRFLELHSH
ncbi:hypothetical protein [Hymenobacter sp. CRA2]|uniref:hypothetical protein n=1 Tax=Hymenobacter sp. CRA2 TaxID=1955620 RepID=UPI00098F5C92|nr:hypothetical protein [Hymenobacter sp. CRA2]OON67825.1 hypothetical protein B0919_16705 [Hymenobacter sp. CRA2]